MKRTWLRWGTCSRCDTWGECYYDEGVGFTRSGCASCGYICWRPA